MYYGIRNSYLRKIELEVLQKQCIRSEEKWREYAALMFSVLVFTVSCSITILIRSFGLQVRQSSVNWKDGRILTDFISV